jgi:ABC-type lipoprotein release transport system permease subunit
MMDLRCGCDRAVTHETSPRIDAIVLDFFAGFGLLLVAMAFTAAMLAVALAATLLPARRALRVDPAIALRVE